MPRDLGRELPEDGEVPFLLGFLDDERSGRP